MCWNFQALILNQYDLWKLLVFGSIRGKDGITGWVGAACWNTPCVGKFIMFGIWRYLAVCMAKLGILALRWLVCFFTLASLHTDKHTQCVYLQVLWVLFSFTGLILLFYLVFYGFLAALFSFTMWAMLQTLNDEVPKYRDQIPSPGNYVVIFMGSNKIGLYFIFSGSLYYRAGRRC